MNSVYKLGVKILLICVCISLAGCSTGSNADEKKSTVQTEQCTDINTFIVEQAEQLAEEGTFEYGDIYVDKILYGRFSQTEADEMLALCKFKNNVHVAGMDRTLAIIFSCETMDVIAYNNFEADEVTIQCLPTDGESRILFLGRVIYQNISTQYMVLYSIQDGEWSEIPLNGVTWQEDDLCYLTDKNNLIVVPQESGDYPTEMSVLWDEQTLYSWDGYAEQFIKVETGEKIIWDDLDGNGEQEYFRITNEENGILSLYFNNELVYRYEDPTLRIVGISEKEYIDLDHDGEKEIFVSFLPNVNSMPLMEWFALKNGENGWELMEMYHENADVTQNSFPISVVLKEKDYILSITCDGCDKEIVYDATKHYERKKKDKEEWNDNTYDMFLGSNFEVGDIVGSTSAWGIWNIASERFEGQNCLVAEHGLQGLNGKYDFYGYLDVYFCYDENAKIKILDIKFREVDDIYINEKGAQSNVVMAESVIDFGEYKDYTLKLVMTEGDYYTDEETAPAGGVYEENYDGQYVLQVRGIDDKIVDEISLNKEWGYETINFPGKFDLCVSDYNADGFLDFTIGTYGSSSMNIFEIYSVDKEGKIVNIGHFTDVSKDFSIYLVQEEGSTDFTSTIWNNATGEAEVVCWKWNVEEGRYIN